MQIVKGRLYIEFNEWIEAGLVRRTGLNQESIKNPADRRQILIDFEALAHKYKEAIEREFGNPYELANNQAILSSPLFTLSETDRQTIQDFKLDDGRALPKSYRETYRQDCRYLNLLAQSTKATVQAMGYPKMGDFNLALRSLIKSDDLTKLPTSRPRLGAELKEYKTKGALCRIEKDAHRFGNSNRAKITKDVGDKLLALYMLPIKMNTREVHQHYTEHYVEEGAPELDESTIRKWLFKTEQRAIWTLARQGKKVYKSEFEHHLKLRKASFSNALWVIDGTKLDMYYQDDKGMAAKLRVNVVMDAHSEMIIGWHLSKTENHIDHYRAFKSAVDTAGVKPAQISYDNQSAHKSDLMQRFYDDLVAEGGAHFPSRAYASQSKMIEQAFGRFQKQVLRKYWFCDGQSPMSKREDSKVNISAVIGEKDTTGGHKDKIKALFPDNRKRLPHEEDIFKLMPRIVSQWNDANYPKAKTTRAERYKTSSVPTKWEQNISFLDRVTLFWITTPKPIKYYKQGLLMTVANEDYEYEVYDADGAIDKDFRKKYINAKLHVQYDPDDMSSVRLLTMSKDGDTQCVATASTKRTHTQVLADMKHGDKSKWDKDFSLRDDELGEVLDEIARIRKKTGITPEALIDETEDILRYGGYATKENRNKAEQHASFLDQL